MMQTVAATNWITLAGIIVALVVQLVLAAWWLGRRIGTHDVKVANAIATEREHRSRAISEHARAVAIDIDHARRDAAVARELIALHKVDVAERLREYPTKTEMRDILSDNLTPISEAIERLFSGSLSRPSRPSRRRRRNAPA